MEKGNQTLEAPHPENRCVLKKIEGLEDVVITPRFRRAAELPDDWSEVYEFLGAGEYNMNFVVSAKSWDHRAVLRVECGSQLGLENQIEYEINALMSLEDSGRTPRIVASDSGRKLCHRGVLLETYLPGSHLDYRSSHDLSCAAHVLADVHTTPIKDDCRLQVAANPYSTMLDECREMASVYLNSEYAKKSIASKIKVMLEQAQDIALKADSKIPHMSIVNTEVNNTNFLINDVENSYLVDWEKPLLTDPAQDVGHFLADTTTFWKTDVIFSEQKKKHFIDEYVDAIGGRFEDGQIFQRCLDMAKFTCLRGVCWCAMAYIQYQDDSKMLRDEFTRRKLDDYLNVNFLDNLALA